jgi:pimeloyl-ACP methyl ester carboxylesterase
MTTFMLVHGAFHGAWCWYKVAALLEANGHRVLIPDLPGHGRNQAAAATATYGGYVDFVSGILREQPEPVVLVGHSMGGGVITGAAEAAPEKVAMLVYLAAFMTQSGTSMSGATTPPPEGAVASIDETGVEGRFYADCPAEDVVLAKLCLSPQALAPLTAPVVWTAARWGRIHRVYIGCSQDRVSPVEEQRARAEAIHGTVYVELDSSHSPFFSMPGALVAALEALSS